MKYLYPALALIFLVSCGKEKKPINYSKSDWASFDLKGHVKTVSEKSFSIDSLGKKAAMRENFSEHNSDLHFDESGRLVLEKKFISEGSPFEEIKYAGRGHKVEYIQYASGKPAVKTTYSWDKSGRHNTIIARNNPDGTQIEKTEIKLKKGLPVEKISYNLQNIITDRIEYLYDNDTILIGENLYLNKETVQYRNLFEYKDKKRTSETKSDSNGKMLSSTKYEYDGDKLVSKINYDEKNEIDNYEKFSYDDKGNVVVHSSFSKMDGELRDIYEYDANNNKISWTISKGDKHEMRAIYTYDKHNNLTSYKFTGRDDEIIESKEYAYVYDKKGNWIKKTTLIANKPKFVLERKITYYK